ncbi:MAG: ferrous iron transport protein B [Myxococcales bacterium]|nr:ferrous iron transport protein B [Myxococcales bacterium]MCB9576263.1 ferrous iron transport protein B [Polyangiaceae bacterium]
MTAAARVIEPDARASRPLVVVVGNPNVGKTTLFNRLTGQNARVGNYPGITVERRVGTLRSSAGDVIELVDVPGAYSLSARSVEEQIAINSVLGFGSEPKPRLAVVVVDAGQLIRNLYLVLQLLELSVPVVIALNMIDEVTDNPPDPAALSALLGVPCVSTDARHGKGMKALAEVIFEALADPPRGRVDLRYPEALRRDADRVADALPKEWRGSVERDRALAMWALTSIEPDDELTDMPEELRDRCLEVQQAAGDRDLDREVIASRYAFLDAHADRLYGRTDRHPKKRASSDRVDKVLLHPVWGFAFFILLMLVLFQALFSWADPAIGWIEGGFEWLAELTKATLPDGIVRDLLVDGVIGGVGNVLVFLPQILLLFLFIGILEDSGYMSRVAFLMDRIMRSLGLHGRAFVPMLSGFACAVPAILATRTMERRRDRLLTMLVIPLMTCSARLPVYTLIIGALFPPTRVMGWIPIQGLLMVAMYVFSTIIALIAAGVLGRTVVKGRRVPLILELPPYRVPNMRSVVRMMWERSTVFLREAGTVILACTVVLWALLYFPKHEPDTNVNRPAVAAVQGTKAQASEQLKNSYAGRIGHAIEPALEPLGFDWKIGVGLIGAFAAREVFVSTMGLVYGVGDGDEAVTPLRERIRHDTRADGKPVYTPLVGLSLMVFFALASQCMSTLAVVRRETRSWRWPAFLFTYMTALAYGASLLVFQVGRLLGF